MTLTTQIKECIEKKLAAGQKKYIIFPFGEVGIQVKRILNSAYDIKEAYIIDNHLCKYNSKIKQISFLEKLECRDYCLILASLDKTIYEELKSSVKKYFLDENIAEFSSMLAYAEEQIQDVTKIGKYSYGPLCRNHPYIEKIGAFCSFAPGTEVVQNHETKYLTTHPMIYSGANLENFRNYMESAYKDWYFPGVHPKKDKFEKRRRIQIGNDVWLGENVIITNYSNIGNGVIAGAGAVITKDVPDYAIVAGVPARIIRYRYLPKEIEALKQIAWWDWTDEEIRERYDDFYLPIMEFIEKYLKSYKNH